MKLTLKSTGLAALLLLTVPTISYADADSQPQDISAEINAELESKSSANLKLKKEKGLDKKAIKSELKELKKNAPDKYSEISKQSDVEAEGISSLASSSSLGTNGDVLITYDSEKMGWNYGHAAVVRWDTAYVIEAWPGDGVRYYKNNWKSRFNSWKGLWVKGATDRNYSDAQSYASGQLGKKYSLAYGKYQANYFYCSLLAWKAWNNTGFNLDDDGGVLVTPGDIDQDTQTVTYASS